MVVGRALQYQAYVFMNGIDVLAEAVDKMVDGRSDAPEGGTSNHAEARRTSPPLNFPASPKPPGKRKRGRPAKISKVPAETPPLSAKKRGRPPKYRPAVVVEAVEKDRKDANEPADNVENAPVADRHFRSDDGPQIQQSSDLSAKSDSEEVPQQEAPATEGKKRGRPRKNAASELGAAAKKQQSSAKKQPHPAKRQRREQKPAKPLEAKGKSGRPANSKKIAGPSKQNTEDFDEYLKKESNDALANHDMRRLLELSILSGKASPETISKYVRPQV